MTLLLEIGVWLAAGLLAAVLVTPRRLLLGALAASSSALSFAAFVRMATATPWHSGQVHVIGSIAAVMGAVLGAVAVRTVDDATSGRRGPSSAGHWSGPRSAP